jgi:hypothetical protein
MDAAMGAKLKMKKLVPRKPAFLKRRESKGGTPPYAAPARELAGKWVAWSKEGHIVASAETLSEVVDFVTLKKIRGASYECLPLLVRNRGR